MNSSSLEKISRITPNIGMIYSGMGPDYRVLTDKARKVSHTDYKRIYNEYPPTRILVQDVAKVMQEATQSGGVRPFGVSLLVAGWDDKPAGTGKGGPALYQVGYDGLTLGLGLEENSWLRGPKSAKIDVGVIL